MIGTDENRAVLHVEVIFWSSKRKTPPSLVSGKYCPHFVVKGTTEYLGVCFLDGAECAFGESALGNAKPLYPDTVDYAPLENDAEFLIYEGANAVGKGRVLSRTVTYKVTEKVGILMFEEFYEMYEPEEQEVVALINRCIGGGYNNRGGFWEMTVVTLGMVFCDTGKISSKEERLEWPVTEEERNSEKGWKRFGNEQICRLKLRRMKEEWAQNLVVRPWCISKVLEANEECPELQAILDEYHKPVVIQDTVLGELTLNKDYDTFEGEIKWCGKDVRLSLEVNAESKSSWTRARSAAKKLLADCEAWDKAMRDFAAKNLTQLANDWFSQDEETTRDPETDPITEEELARRISLLDLTVTSGGRFTAYFDCDEMFTDHAVGVYGSLKKGVKDAGIA